MTNNSGELNQDFVRDCIKKILTLEHQMHHALTPEQSNAAKVEAKWEKISFALHIGKAIAPDALGEELTGDQEKIVTGFIQQVVNSDPELQEFIGGLISGV